LGNIDGSSPYSNRCGAVFEGTGLVYSHVRIVLFSGEATIVENVLECMGWETSTAAMVIISTSTINQLLFT